MSSNSKILLWDLRFFNKVLEQEYSKSKEKYQMFFLIILVLYGFLIGFVGWFINPFKKADHFEGEMLSIRIGLLIILPIFLGLGLKFPGQREKLVVVLLLFFFFALMEGTSKNRASWNGIMFFITGMQVEFTAFPLMLGKINWKLSCLVSSLLRMMCSFRYTDFQSNQDMNFYPLVQYTQNIIIHALSAYFVEKLDRESFHKIKTYEDSLSCYKGLITDIFPSAIIIIKNQKIAFHNTQALLILDCGDQGEIHRFLQRLKVDEGIDLPIEVGETLETEENKPLNKRLISLENFILKSIPFKKTVIVSPKTKLQNSYCGVFSIGAVQKSLEIKTTNIIWEDEKAFMIIISESKVVQDLKRVNEQSEYKDRLLATVSHDLRTPLNGIIGMIRMVMEMVLEQGARKYLNIALRSSFLLLMMINDILDFSQISSGKLRLAFESFNLWDLIKDVSKLFKFQAKLKGLEFAKLKLSSGNEESFNITSDQNRLKQVLFNLLGNALKFTPKGSIRIKLRSVTDLSTSEISLFGSSQQKSKVFQISVEDTGIGIKEEDQKYLFKLFGKLQNENTNTLNKSGVGLGLAISQSLVQILNSNRENAEIKVKSEYGKGSCFSFLIYSQGSAEEVRSPKLHEKPEKDLPSNSQILERQLVKKDRIVQERGAFPKDPSSKRILVVDDDQINILVISAYLKSLPDIVFDVAFNGEDALDTIKAKADLSFYYDIIFMDCNMPKMDGFEATTLINALVEEGKIPSVVIVACTANASPKDFELCFQSGMDDHITKPFSKDEIKKMIDKYL